MTSTPSPRSTPAPPEEGSPRSAPTSHPPITLPDRSIPSWALGNDSTSTESKPSFVPAWRRPTLHAPGVVNADSDGRRPSVQFVPPAKNTPGTSRSSSAHAPSQHQEARRATHAGHHHVVSSRTHRRMSSPPPPAQFRPSVSFDTFANKEASGDFSLTLNRKHRSFQWTKRSRTFLVGTDTNDYSDTALEWLLDELVDDGDEVVCLRVVEKDSREATRWAGGQGEKGYRLEAERFLEAIQEKNTEDKSISLILEFSIGKVQESIQQMIKIYEPAMLVVGTRGRSLTGYQGLLSSGSVSKYCLQYSPVPVIVVRPSSKRESKKRKRLQDPERRGYRDILDKSEDPTATGVRGRGGHLLDQTNRHSIIGADLGILGQLAPTGDDEEEARRVAEAIGYTKTHPSNSTTNLSSSRRASSVDAPPSPHLSERVLQSPDLNATDGDPFTDDSASDSGEDVDEFGGRPEDEAAMLARERALEVAEDIKEDAEARGRGGEGKSREEGTGSGVLALLGQLDRGMK
nr:hypothetical protein B0A51_09857 [Rachicladosporium sp. CCFEE 5018]